MDQKGYKAYKDITGSYSFPSFTLFVDHIQADPYAPPSRLRVRYDLQKLPLQKEWLQHSFSAEVIGDFLARGLKRALTSSRALTVDAPGQEILARTAVAITDQFLEFRLSVSLPAAGRKILGKQASQVLTADLPKACDQTAFQFNQEDLVAQLECTANQFAIRKAMTENGWVGFVANSSILPRVSGVSNKPLATGKVVSFQAPKERERTVTVPYGEPIKGMAIEKGVTVIVGGGYHGKSTLLKALERGVYNHILGDGREYVLTDDSAVKVRAEDGRRIEKVDISPFISNLPFGKTTTAFQTEDASGSTSQAASIIEAIEAKATTLLLDEDTSATNFMIRDARMQRLVHKDKEPITPFIDQVRPLSTELGVSTVLVVGGAGDYLDVADTVLMLDEYSVFDVTAQAGVVAEEIQTTRTKENKETLKRPTERKMGLTSVQSSDQRKGAAAKGLHTIMHNKQALSLSFVEQLVDTSQTRAIAACVNTLASQEASSSKSIAELIDSLYETIEQKGLDGLSSFRGHPGDLAKPRKQELFAALNRLRSLRVKN